MGTLASDGATTQQLNINLVTPKMCGSKHTQQRYSWPHGILWTQGGHSLVSCTVQTLRTHDRLTSKRVFTTVMGRNVQAAKARAEAPTPNACKGPRVPSAFL